MTDMPAKIQKVSVKAIVQKGSKILLVKDNKGMWELPGGKIKFGENPNVALKRELAEELGWINVDILNIIDCWSFISRTNKHFIILIYECAARENKIKNNQENIEYKWLPVFEIDNFKMRDGYKKSIKNWYEKFSIL